MHVHGGPRGLMAHGVTLQSRGWSAARLLVVVMVMVVVAIVCITYSTEKRLQIRSYGAPR